MVNNTNSITGQAMAVIIGAILIIGSFLPSLGVGFFGRLGLFLLGSLLLFLGVRR